MSKAKTKVLTPIKAIRAKCLDCSAGQKKEVRLCPVVDCSLYPYRMGKRPTQGARKIQDREEKGKGIDAEKKKRAELA